MTKYIVFLCFITKLFLLTTQVSGCFKIFFLWYTTLLRTFKASNKLFLPVFKLSPVSVEVNIYWQTLI